MATRDPFVPNSSIFTFAPNGSRVAIASYDGQIEVLDFARKMCLNRFNHSKSKYPSIDVLVFDPTGRYLVAASGDRTISVWDTHTGSRVLTSSYQFQNWGEGSYYSDTSIRKPLMNQT